MKKIILIVVSVLLFAALITAEVSKVNPVDPAAGSTQLIDPAVRSVIVGGQIPVTVTSSPPADKMTGVIVPPQAPVFDAAGTTATSGNAVTVTAVITDFSPDDINVDVSPKDSIKLSWTPKQKDNIYYNVYRAQTVDYIKLNDAEFLNPEYVDFKILSATSYFYKVEAYDTSRNAYMSKTKSARSLDIINPQPPAGLKSFQDVNSISLRWASGGQGSYPVSGYNLYRGRTPDDNNFLKFIPYTKIYYTDDEVEPGLRYYYKMAAIDIKGNESKLTDPVTSVPFPKPRTNVCLMPTAYRNSIYDNMGLNVDTGFTYFIGTIYGEHNTGVLGKGTDTFKKNGVWLLSLDVKWTFFNEGQDWYPSLGLGLMYSLLLQDSVGASSSFSQGVGTTIGKAPVLGQQGVFFTATKNIGWDITANAGYMQGFKLYKDDKGKGAAGYLTYITSAILGGNNFSETGSQTSNTSAEVRNAYFIGLSRDIFKKIGIKIELTVPLEFNKNPFMPETYIINTHIDKLFNFDIAYIHYDGGYAWLGYYNLRFSIYPSPYK